MTSLLYFLVAVLFSCISGYSFSGLWSTKPKSARNSIITDLRKEISTTPYDDRLIIASIERLIEDNALSKDEFDINSINGNWKMLWTTEKETLTFKKNGFLGSKCLDISQSIDLKQGLINNVIDFANSKRFTVRGTVSADQSITRRANFKFTGASLSFGYLAIPLPPVGQGWFDNVYVDKTLRIVKDIRGDYLITERVDDNI